MSDNANKQHRIEIIDQIKGILIILVIIGHVSLEKIENSILRETIYFFHMPLFFAITGFFIKETIKDMPISKILKKYKDSILIPYFIAFIFYSIFFKYSITYPYYHLWYIPAMLLFILYLKALLKIKEEKKIIYITLLTFFIIATIFFESYSQWQLSDNYIYRKLGDKRFYYYFIYFYLGYLFSRIDIKKHIKKAIILLNIGILIYILSEFKLMIGFGKTIANASIIYIMIYIFKNQEKKHEKTNLLSILGKLSLPLYLWHVLPIKILQSLNINETLYYISTYIILILFLISIIKAEGKNRLIDKLIYGKNSMEITK